MDANLLAFDVATKELKECKEYGDHKFKGSYSSLYTVMSQLVAWAKAEHARLDGMPVGKQARTTSGDEWLVVMQDQYGISGVALGELVKHVKAARDGANASQKNESTGLVVGTASLTALGEFTNAASFLSSDNGAYARDFRVVVRMNEVSSNRGGGGGGRGGRRSYQRGGGGNRSSGDDVLRNVHIHIWCLNPALAFRALERATRTLLLASGTLSPLDSFASELDVEFPQRYRLQANHVIDKQQLLSVVLPCGPTPRRHKLSSVYVNSQSPLYIEALGQTLASLLPSIDPGGSLCFFPSYTLMQRCVQAWQVSCD
jgi:hypothetical protein